MNNNMNVMFYGFSVIIISFLLLSCQSDTKKMETSDNHQQEPLEAVYLALGDSYTIGESVAAEERFPQQLVSRLKTETAIDIQLQVVAKTGWTTGELTDAIDDAAIESTFELVSLLIGVNNQYRGMGTAVYRQEFVQLLQTAIGFAGGDAARVVVLSIPDYGVTPFAANMDTAKIAREIDAFNAINFAETAKTAAKYFDITPISRRAAVDPGLIAADGLHPSAKMYGEWVEKLMPDAVKIISSK
jgi:lysophospholipase L1-like esterase